MPPSAYLGSDPGAEQLPLVELPLHHVVLEHGGQVGLDAAVGPEGGNGPVPGSQDGDGCVRLEGAPDRPLQAW